MTILGDGAMELRGAPRGPETAWDKLLVTLVAHPTCRPADQRGTVHSVHEDARRVIDGVAVHADTPITPRLSTTSEGKTKKEIVRSLKRSIARQAGAAVRDDRRSPPLLTPIGDVQARVRG